MNVKVFDTHVRTVDGGYLHFDVLIEGNDQALATRYAREWLASRGVEEVAGALRMAAPHCQELDGDLYVHGRLQRPAE